MTTDQSSPIANETEATEDAAAEAVAEGTKALDEAIAKAERAITDAVKAAERAFKDGIERLRAHTSSYTGDPAQQLDEAHKYLTERVKERPMTAMFAGLGVGLILGMLISNRSR